MLTTLRDMFALEYRDGLPVNDHLFASEAAASTALAGLARTINPRSVTIRRVSRLVRLSCDHCARPYGYPDAPDAPDGWTLHCADLASVSADPNWGAYNIDTGYAWCGNCPGGTP